MTTNKLTRPESFLKKYILLNVAIWLPTLIFFYLTGPDVSLRLVDHVIIPLGVAIIFVLLTTWHLFFQKGMAINIVITWLLYLFLLPLVPLIDIYGVIMWFYIWVGIPVLLAHFLITWIMTVLYKRGLTYKHLLMIFLVSGFILGGISFMNIFIRCNNTYIRCIFSTFQTHRYKFADLLGL